MHLEQFLIILTLGVWTLAEIHYRILEYLYHTRQKKSLLARLEQQADLTGDDSSVAITLPRMSFDITGYAYDPARKLNKNQKLSVCYYKLAEIQQN